MRFIVTFLIYTLTDLLITWSNARNRIPQEKCIAVSYWLEGVDGAIDILDHDNVTGS